MTGRGIDELHIWTVYERPTDYPHCYVARDFLITQNGAAPTGKFMISNDLDRLREMLNRLGLARLDRSPIDEPQIVESWI